MNSALQRREILHSKVNKICLESVKVHKKGTGFIFFWMKWNYYSFQSSKKYTNTQRVWALCEHCASTDEMTNCNRKESTRFYWYSGRSLSLIFYTSIYRLSGRIRYTKCEISQYWLKRVKVHSANAVFKSYEIY